MPLNLREYLLGTPFLYMSSVAYVLQGPLRSYDIKTMSKPQSLKASPLSSASTFAPASENFPGAEWILSVPCSSWGGLPEGRLVFGLH